MTPGSRAPARPAPPGVTAAWPEPPLGSCGVALSTPPRPGRIRTLPLQPRRPDPPTARADPAAYLKEPNRLRPRGRGPGQSPHRRTRAPRLGAHAPKPGQLALFRAQGEPQESLPVSRSPSSYSRHLRWRPQRPRRRGSRAAPANEPSTRCSSSRPAAPLALCFCASLPGSGCKLGSGIYHSSLNSGPAPRGYGILSVLKDPSYGLGS
uniref:Uncharacterized protein n=1 Tax=Neovison vison TaxID=452646 RepID=A0A8C7ARZ1_NEOVI